VSPIGYCAVLLERRPTIEWRRRSGRIPASRELASDHAQGKFTALLNACFQFVGRVPGCPSANTNHPSAFGCGNSIRCNLSRRASGTSMRMVGVTGNDRTAASRK
jgi:hypothetical protein